MFIALDNVLWVGESVQRIEKNVTTHRHTARLHLYTEKIQTRDRSGRKA